MNRKTVLEILTEHFNTKARYLGTLPLPMK